MTVRSMSARLRYVTLIELLAVIGILMTLFCRVPFAAAQGFGDYRRQFNSTAKGAIAAQERGRSQSKANNAARADRMRQEAEQKNLDAERKKNLARPHIQKTYDMLVEENGKLKPESQIPEVRLNELSRKIVDARLSSILGFLDWINNSEGRINSAMRSAKTLQSGGTRIIVDYEEQQKAKEQEEETDGDVTKKRKKTASKDIGGNRVTRIIDDHQETNDIKRRENHLHTLNALLQECKDRTEKYEEGAMSAAKRITKGVIPNPKDDTEKAKQQYILNEFFERVSKKQLWDKDGLPTYPRGKAKELTILIERLQNERNISENK